MQTSCFISLALALLLMSAVILAPTATGPFVGVITDQSGAVVQGATIVITNKGTNRSVTFISNESGAYVAPLLNPGEYDLAVSKTGFKKAVRGLVTLQVDQRAAVDFTLASGDLSETVEVQATAPLLETGSSSLGQVINNKKIVGLPLNARGVFNLVALSPGAIPNQDNFFVQQADSSINPSLFKANGGSGCEAQHLAAELVGHYKIDRQALPAIAFSADGALLTCLGNDFAFEHIFVRQVEALGNPGDVLIVFSTSGNSRNVLRALESARGAA